MVFENHRKCLILHCERSELRYIFSKLIKNTKNGVLQNSAKFRKILQNSTKFHKMPQNATKYGINVSKNCSKLKTNDNEISVFFTEYENCDKNSFYAFYEMASESSKKGEKVRTFEMRHFWCFLTTVVCGCSTILHWPSPLATMRF